MKKRILTGAIILLGVAVFLLSRLYTPYAFDAFVAVMAIMGGLEVSRALERKRMFANNIIVAAYPAVLFFAMFLGIRLQRDWTAFLLYFIAIIFALFIINFLITIIFRNATKKEKDKFGVFDSNTKYAFNKCMNTTFVMVYPTILFMALAMINHYFDFAFVTSAGVKDTSIVTIFFLVFTFVVTMSTDTFALVVGMLMGGPKLCPKISPKKTISGAIGGLFFGVLSGLLVYLLFSTNMLFKDAINLFNLEIWQFGIIGAITSIVGQAGDLVASALKRSARLKDYGTIFPGHGGVMDRVDGLIFNSAVVLICMFIVL